MDCLVSGTFLQERLENPAEVMQLQEVAQQYNRFFKHAVDLNHSMSQVLILFVGLLLLFIVVQFVLLIKKKLLLANILYPPTRSLALLLWLMIIRLQPLSIII